MAFESLLETVKVKLKTAESLLAAHDPRNILKLGYSITLNESGKTVKSANNLKVGDELKTQFAKGSIWSKINKKEDA
jgi:exodeoxyribonuclease VII large subunit